MRDINPALPTPKPWSGAPGVLSGEPRPEPVQEQQRRLTMAENALAHQLGTAGIPLDAAAQLAVIILEMRSQVEHLQERVRELVGE
jgi:hypothetical protein